MDKNEKNISTIIKNFILYAGYSKEEYLSIRPNVREQDFKTWRFLSVVLSIVFTVLLILSFVNDSLRYLQLSYTVCTPISIVFMILFFTVRGKDNRFVIPYVFVESLSILAVGVIIGLSSLDQNVVTFFILMFAIPVFFAAMPIIVDIVIIAGSIALIVCALLLKPEAVAKVDFLNALAFMFVDILLNHYLQKIHFKNILSNTSLKNANVQLNTELANALNKLEEENVALEESLKKAETAAKAKSNFLFSMSHDIRTPMNAITGYAVMAKKHIDEKEEVLDYLDKIDVSGKQLLSLLTQVLEMSSIETGKLEIVEEELNLVDLSNAMMTVTSTTANSRGVDLKLEIKNLTHPLVMGDTNHLNQILINVLSNAVKFTSEGGKVTYTVEETQSVKEGYATYTFTTKDTGIGMSEEFLANIYEAFSKANTSTISGVQGTGLGMAIVKSLLDKMGGKIEVNSKEGVGTTVKIIIDLKLQEVKEEVMEDSQEEFDASVLKGMRVLLVDDNEMNREIAKDILEFEGVIIEEADDGDIAVEMVKNSEPGYYNCILMDIQMPKMNGYDATKAIRNLDPPLCDIPILAMTANTFEEDKKNAFSVGMNEHLPKPIDIDKLTQSIAMYALKK